MTSPLMALRFSGRLMVIQNACPRFSSSTLLLSVIALLALKLVGFASISATIFPVVTCSPSATSIAAIVPANRRVCTCSIFMASSVMHRLAGLDALALLDQHRDDAAVHRRAHLAVAAGCRGRRRRRQGQVANRRW